jgi:hypothetical protein
MSDLPRNFLVIAKGDWLLTFGNKISPTFGSGLTETSQKCFAFQSSGATTQAF